MLSFIAGVFAGMLLVGVGSYLGLQVWLLLTAKEGTEGSVLLSSRMGRPDNRKALEYRSLERIAEVEQEVLRGRKQSGSSISR